MSDIASPDRSESIKIESSVSQRPVSESDEEQAGHIKKRFTKAQEVVRRFLRPPKELPIPPAQELAHDEKVEIDLDSPLADKGEVYARFGINGRLVASINAGGKIFHIIDVREIGTNRDFFIIDDTYKHDSDSKKGFKGVAAFTEPVVIGRANHQNRFEYPSTVSRNHFMVEFNKVKVLDQRGELIITNLEPRNSTILTAYTKKPNAETPQLRINQAINDIRTYRAEVRLQNNPNFGEKDETAPYGYYLNHPVLGRNSLSVDNGVYLGGGAREAILVDGRSETLKKVYEDLAENIRKGFKDRETATTQTILFQVMQKAQQVMPYDGPKTSQISKEFYGDKLIGLSTYVNQRAGVCRHQGLLAAYLTERLINEGFLNGGIGIERNTDDDFGGTHAWAVFKPGGGKTNETIVIDPAQSFVGTKNQAERENRWRYRLSTDEY